MPTHSNSSSPGQRQQKPAAACVGDLRPGRWTSRDLAIAQLVLTLTVAGVDRVAIRIEELLVALPLTDGVLLTDPVTFTDCRVLVDR